MQTAPAMSSATEARREGTSSSAVGLIAAGCVPIFSGMTGVGSISAALLSFLLGIGDVISDAARSISDSDIQNPGE